MICKNLRPSKGLRFWGTAPASVAQEAAETKGISIHPSTVSGRSGQRCAGGRKGPVIQHMEEKSMGSRASSVPLLTDHLLVFAVLLRAVFVTTVTVTLYKECIKFLNITQDFTARVSYVGGQTRWVTFCSASSYHLKNRSLKYTSRSKCSHNECLRWRHPDVQSKNISGCNKQQCSF